LTIKQYPKVVKGSSDRNRLLVNDKRRCDNRVRGFVKENNARFGRGEGETRGKSPFFTCVQRVLK
jgi:hypothetical protein